MEIYVAMAKALKLYCYAELFLIVNEYLVEYVKIFTEMIFLLSQTML